MGLDYYLNSLDRPTFFVNQTRSGGYIKASEYNTLRFSDESLLCTIEGCPIKHAVCVHSVIDLVVSNKHITLSVALNLCTQPIVGAD